MKHSSYNLPNLNGKHWTCSLAQLLQLVEFTSVLRFGSSILTGSSELWAVSVAIRVETCAKLFTSWPVVPWNPWNFCSPCEPWLPFEPLEPLLPLLSLTQCFPWPHEPLESLEHKWPLGSQAASPVCKSLMLGIAKSGRSQAKLLANLGLQRQSRSTDLANRNFWATINSEGFVWNRWGMLGLYCFTRFTLQVLERLGHQNWTRNGSHTCARNTWILIKLPACSMIIWSLRVIDQKQYARRIMNDKSGEVPLWYDYGKHWQVPTKAALSPNRFEIVSLCSSSAFIWYLPVFWRLLSWEPYPPKESLTQSYWVILIPTISYFWNVLFVFDHVLVLATMLSCIPCWTLHCTRPSSLTRIRLEHEKKQNKANIWS